MGNMSENSENCATCNQIADYNTKSVLCELCELWFHSECQQIPTKTYKALKDDNNDHLTWYCKSCKIVSKGILKKLSNLEKDIQELRVQVTTPQQNNQAKPEVSYATMVKKVLNEESNLKKRAKNFIIKGATPKPPAEEKVFVQNMIEALNIEVASETIVVKHIGNVHTNGQQLIHVTLESEVDRNKILRMAKKLKEIPAYRDMYINKDLTKEEIETQYNLRQELKKCRAENESIKYVIRNDRIVVRKD